MQQLIYTLLGIITNQNTQPLEGFWVKVIFQKPQQPKIETVDPVQTDQQGQYEITFNLSNFNIDEAAYMEPDMFIQVSDPATGAVLGESEIKRNVLFKTEIDLQVTYPLQVEDPKVTPPYILIKGTVLDILGRPLKNALVELWEDGGSSYTLESEQTDQNGAFELILVGDLHDIAMDCAEFHFKIRYGDKLVANTQEQEPPLFWDIGKEKDNPLEIRVSVVGKVKEVLQPKVLAVSLAEQANIPLDDFPKTHENLKKKVQELAENEVRKQLHSALGDSLDEGLKSIVDEIDFSRCASKKLPIVDYIEAQLRKKKIGQFQFDEIQNKLEDSDLPKHFTEILPNEKPLKEIPFLQTLLEEGKGHQLAKVAGLPQKKCNELLQKGWRTNDGDFRMLEALNEEGALTNAQTKGLKQTIELHSLFDEHLPLTQALKNGPVIGTSHKLKTLKDLVPIRAEQWGTVITGLSDLQLPEGLGTETYSKILEKRVERAFPTAAMLDRYQSVKKTDLKPDFQKMQKVLEKSPDLLKTKDLESADFSGMTKAEVKAFRTSYDSTLKKLNRYHGLNVHRMTKDANGSFDIDQHVSTVSTKIKQLEIFYKQNSDKELLSMNFGPEADLEAQGIDFTGIAEENQLGILRNLKTRQRTHDLASGDLNTANKLLENGLYTGVSIANLSVTSLATTLGLHADQVISVQNKACLRQRQTVDFLAKVNDLRSGFQDIAIGNNITAAPLDTIDWSEVTGRTPPQEIINFESHVLRKYDGYEEFFGSLDYCNCNHCSSIFSPAAYFVDLMAWLEKLVLNDVFPNRPDLNPENNPKNHRLHLQNRRPDLWYLDLSCENTDTLVPYLDIINEVLENYIFYLNERKSSDSPYYKQTPFETIQALEREHDSGKNLDEDRYAIPEKVHKAIYYEVKLYSINAPFLLPLEELKVYLKHFPISLEEVAEVLNTEENHTLTRARLGISKQEHDIITKSGNYTDIDTIEKLKVLYDLELLNSIGEAGELDVQKLLAALQVTRDELSKLIKTRFINFFILGQEALSVKAKKKNPGPNGDIQNNIEVLIGLDIVGDTIPNLDRLHRFVRLWRNVPWAIGELDLVLRAVVNEYSGIAPDELQEQYHQVGKVLSLYQRFDKPIEETLVLFSQMESVESGIFGRLFNHLFNKPPFSDLKQYPKRDVLFIHPVFDNSTEVSSKELPRLLAGLDVTDDVLYQLIKKESPLNTELKGFDDNGDYVGFTIGAPNLSLLYRHARLAEWLQLSVPELFTLLRLEPEIEANFINHGKIDDLEKLLRFYDWWKTTEYTLEELEFLLSDETMEKGIELTQNILKNIENDKAIVFADTVFAYLEGVTEEQSKEIIRLNVKYSKIVSNDTSEFLLPNGLEIKDGPIGDNAESMYSVEETKEKLLMFFDSLTGDEKFNSDLFYQNRSQIGLENTLSKNISSQLFYINEAHYKVDKSSIIHLAETKTYRVRKDADISALRLEANPEAFLMSRQKDGAAAISLVDLKQKEIAHSIVETVLEEITSPNSFELTPHYDQEKNSFFIPDHIPITGKEINGAISRYRRDVVLQSYAAQALQISSDKVEALNKLSGLPATHTDFSSSSLNIENWVAAIYKLSLIYKAKEYDFWSSAQLKDESTLKDGIIAALPKYTPQANLSREFLEQVNYLRPFLSLDTLSDLIVILSNYDTANQQFKTEDDQANQSKNTYPHLITLLNSELTPIKLVNAQDNLGINAIEALVRFNKRVQLSEYLGIGGNLLKHILSDKYDDLVIARNALLGAFRLKYTDNAQWEEKIEPFQDKIRGVKRDALTDYLIKGLEKVPMSDGDKARLFPNRREIYKHFLIDTELEGCARTSKLVGAISSVQLFIQRIQLNLETSQDGSLVIEPQGEDKVLFKNQWEWRKNYRVWEANRKVFLYPENYIEPELRDNKTELFKEFETDLLQREVTQETVEEAFKKYLDGFEKLNNLQVAGAYHEKVIRSGLVKTGFSYNAEISPDLSEDSIHLFGISPKDDNRLFYRKLDNTFLSSLKEVKANWNSWEEVSLKIPVKKVSPIIYNGKTLLFWNQISTKANNIFIEGKLSFKGYEHKLTNFYSIENINGNWETPSRINHSEDLIGKKYENVFVPIKTKLRDGTAKIPVKMFVRKEHVSINEYVLYATDSKGKVGNVAILDFIENAQTVTQFHNQAIDGYSISGYNWDKVYPSLEQGLSLKYANFQINRSLNLWSNTLEKPSNFSEITYGGNFWSLTDDKFIFLKAFGEVDRNEVKHLHIRFDLPETEELASISFIETPNNIELIPDTWGKGTNAIINDGNKKILVHQVYDENVLTFKFEAKVLGSINLKKLAKKLFERELASFYERSFQFSLYEKNHSFTTFRQNGKEFEKVKTSSFNKDFPDSIYYWELFFHIPFLIANHYNSQQKFEEAQQWYHYIFNPSAQPENPYDKKYAWQFRAFYENNIRSMREHLKDNASIRVYENDPFNPQAIAHTRISANQKTIVMKYIDNLLDWGDHLFAQDTMESINEATMLYSLAYEILGDRPADIGDCGEKKAKKTYQSFKLNSTLFENQESQPIPIFIEEVEAQQIQRPEIKNSDLTSTFSQSNWISSNTGGSQSLQVCSKETPLPDLTPVFCIPKNKDLIAYWDRVDDRLFKIRNCMNIQGIKRDLSLFAPEIDARLLVRARAQGLSIQEALESLNGQLPPYRFPFLMAKAKEYVGLVQGFGSALQGALERKDLEYLTLLQATHQKNIQSMSRYIRDKELDAVESNLEMLDKRKQLIISKVGYFKELLENGLNDGENAQLNFKYAAKLLETAAAYVSTAGAIAHAVPSIVGFSNEVNTAGKTINAISKSLGFFGSVVNTTGEIAGIHASYARRENSWKFQLNSTKDELKVIEEQIKGAEIRKVITQRNYEIFEQNVEQQDEVFDFIKDKFSNLGLYTWLSSELMRLYRQAWNSAQTMAKMAERAYRFERSDDSSPLLEGGYWDSGRQGLLAGQKLMIDLQNLERRYLETHHRKMEVDQSFSLMQIAPLELLNLKQTGECNFEIPELFFDLAYPGQYKRRIRSARLTIPCIVGPYVNVGATLSLTGSRIRVNANHENLKEMPPTRTTTIATSTAQNDSGVFEFSFRDERYMPFEGAGAISDWHLKLPKTFRTFDYNTINDVILHISYEADYDGALAEKVEKTNATFSHSIDKMLKEEGLSRIFSLRQEFSDTFHKLLHKDGTFASFEIRNKHFPIFVQGKLSEIKIVSPKLIFVTDLTKEETEANSFEFMADLSEVEPTTQLTFPIFDSGGKAIYTKEVALELENLQKIDQKNTISVSIKKSFESDKIKDVLLYMDYKF